MVTGFPSVILHVPTLRLPLFSFSGRKRNDGFGTIFGTVECKRSTFENTKIMPVKSLQLEPLLSDRGHF